METEALGHLPDAKRGSLSWLPWSRGTTCTKLVESANESTFATENIRTPGKLAPLRWAFAAKDGPKARKRQVLG